MMFVETRKRVEWAIISAFVTDAIRSGCQVNVFDGEETVLRGSTDLKEIRAALFSVDEETIRFYDRQTGHRVGFVHLTHGNGGWDVVQDYSDNERTREIMRRSERVGDRMADIHDETWGRHADCGWLGQ